jgi:preprotein translocase subunit SecE
MKEKVINFFNDIVREMDKVTWPTRDELMESTKVVIIVTLLIAIFTYFVDLGVSKALQAIL